MARSTDSLLVSRLSDADRLSPEADGFRSPEERRSSLLEVGIGERPGVAAGLAAAGADVRATDVHEYPVPAGVRFRVEDLTAVGEPDAFHDVDVVYALNCPPELHRPLRAFSRRVGADCFFTTLGTDEPAVPVEREQLTDTVDGDPVRVTLYVAETSP
jgi:hypothetical protein